MNRVVSILCRRDNMSVKEATELVKLTCDEIFDSCGDWPSFEVSEAIMSNNLGLEMDYIMDVLDIYKEEDEDV